MASPNKNIVPLPESSKAVTRVWCDGCYDLVHFGHANSLRQAKALGGQLIVGVHSDKEIAENKSCPPVFNEKERYEMVRAIKWVDQVIEDAPYLTTVDTLNEYGCHFSAHGNDITFTADGTDTYKEVKDAARYKEYQRTQGVSTTDLIGRMLKRINKRLAPGDNENSKGSSGDPQISAVQSPWTGRCQFFATAGKFRCFTDPIDPKEGDRIVYVPGTFDVLHPGHLSFLEKARLEGDYLIVGCYGDTTVNIFKGSPPIMSLYERAMSLLACKYVSDVLFDAPYIITKDLLESFKIGVVAHGKRIPIICDPLSGKDPYEEAKLLGIFSEIESGTDLTTDVIVSRVEKNKQLYEDRNSKKEKKELEIFEGMKNNAS